jgi:adenosylcobinamide-phosphate synthase
MAGALQVRLGGRNFYRGELIEAPLMGENFPSPSKKNARAAIQIVSVVSALGVAAALLLRRSRG